MKSSKREAKLVGLLGGILALGVALGACSIDSKHVSRSAKSADQRPPALRITGSIEPGGATNARTHKLHSIYVPDRELPKDVVPEVRLTIADQAGNTIFEQTQTGFESDWSFGLEGAEGMYKARAEVLKDKHPEAFKSAEPWEGDFELDVTQPRLALDAHMAVNVATGQRALSASLTVAGETSAECDEAWLKPVNPEQAVAIAFVAEDETALAEGTHRFAGQLGAIADDLAGPFILTVKCHDRAGNPAELMQPVTTERLDYGMAAALDAEIGKAVGGTGAVAFVRPGEVTLHLKLIQTATAVELAPKAVDLEKALLWVFVTESKPASVADLHAVSAPLASQNLESDVVFRLPGDYDGAKTIYVSVVRREPGSTKETLIGVQTLAIFVDGEGPSTNWLSATAFKPAAKGISLTERLEVVAEGAPTKKLETVEYSTDGESWQSTAATIKLVSSAAGRDVYDVTVKYPFAADQGFRLRAVLDDLAGNEVTTAAGPQMVGRPGLSLAVSQATRDACKSDGVNLSRFTPLLASRVLCRLPNGSELGDELQAQIILQNRGLVPVTFYQNPGKMGYRIVADGEVVAEGHEPSPATFAFAPSETHLFRFAVEPAWLEADRLEMFFDIEPTDSKSIDNSCYAATVYPSVVLQDVANGLTLEDVKFACPAAGALSL